MDRKVCKKDFNEVSYNNLFDVDPSLLIPKEELMDEEDDFEEEKGANSRKSLAPLFLYKIITFDIRAYHKFTQQELINRLDEYPYEISMKRQAVSRVVRSLASFDCRIRVYTDGIVFEPDSAEIFFGYSAA